MKKQDDELWLKKVRESLGGYSESPPGHCWERLEEELHSGFSLKRSINSHKIWLSVAAIAFFVLGGAGIYLLLAPSTDDIQKTMTEEVFIPDTVPSAPTPGILIAKSDPLPATQTGKKRQPPVTREEYVDIDTNEDTAPTDESQPEVKPETREKTTTDESTPQGKQATRPSSKSKLHLPVETGKGQKKKWSLGVSVNSSTSSDASNSNGSQALYSQKVDITNPTDDFTNIPLTSNVYFADGIAYMTLSSLSELDWDHRQPVSVGVSVRKELADRIYLETGVTYTFLSSEAKGGSGDKIKQSFHYMGIPVRVNWDFIKHSQFALYLAGGGMVERCIYGKTAGQTNTINRLQLSVSGALGAQYTVYKNIGLFVEPGVSYFFDDGSDAVTIRSDRRFNFNLQAGLRFTY